MESIYSRIIFSDIDGVLNTDSYLNSIMDELKKFCKENFEDKNLSIMTIDDFDIVRKWAMIRIDLEKLKNLSELSLDTKSKVVIISSWKTFYFFSLVMLEFRKRGVPVIGKTIDNGSNRGEGIRNFIKEKHVKDYVILDDEMSYDYTNELLEKLVLTTFQDGLTKEKVEDAKKILLLKKVNS